jgi:hypothetical protein
MLVLGYAFPPCRVSLYQGTIAHQSSRKVPQTSQSHSDPELKGKIRASSFSSLTLLTSGQGWPRPQITSERNRFQKLLQTLEGPVGSGKDDAHPEPKGPEDARRLREKLWEEIRFGHLHGVATHEFQRFPLLGMTMPTLTGVASITDEDPKSQACNRAEKQNQEYRDAIHRYSPFLPTIYRR